MKSKTKEKYNNEIVGIILLTFSIISMISLYSDKTGIIGKELVVLLKSLFGVGAYAISLLILVYSLFLLFRNRSFLDYKRIICLLITFLCFINMVQIYLYDNTGYFKNYVLDSIKHGLNGAGGGIVSAITVFVLVKFLGVIGSWLFLISTLIISIILLTDISLIESIKSVYRQMFQLIEKYKNKKKTLEFNDENILPDIVEKPNEKKIIQKKKLQIAKNNN